MTDLFYRTSAVLSPCGLYRYELRREWDEDLPAICRVMLNPSTADALADDPTVRRVVVFTRALGGGAAVVVNLFALRATSPQVLYKAADPVGPDNNRHVLAAVAYQRTVLAWGGHGGCKGRGVAVLDLLRRLPGQRLYCLGHTHAGQPRHPLYVRAGTPLEEYT
jgi:hypothetical protein